MRFFDKLSLAFEGVYIAFDSIRANKVRAALTISGVAIGVFVVVAMAATVNGIQQSFQKDLDELGANSFFVQRRSPGINACDGSDDRCPDRRNPPMTLEEYKALAALSEADAVVGQISSSASFSYRDKLVKNVGYDAYTTDWVKTDRADIFPGRSFTASEYNSATNVALVNDTLKTQLFKESDPIGKQIAIDGQAFTVIGVFHTKGGFLKSLNGRGPDNPRAIVPMLTGWRHMNVSRRGLIASFQPRADVSQEVAMDAVTALLRGKRGLKPGTPNNFYLVGQERILELFNQLFGAIFLVGLTLSGVGLLVGGVGVVAIMMISVTERTREIGVRKDDDRRGDRPRHRRRSRAVGEAEHEHSRVSSALRRVSLARRCRPHRRRIRDGAGGAGFASRPDRGAAQRVGPTGRRSRPGIGRLTGITGLMRPTFLRELRRHPHHGAGPNLEQQAPVVLHAARHHRLGRFSGDGRGDHHWDECVCEGEHRRVDDRQELVHGAPHADPSRLLR
jgi:putative ABC transport system permease protein